MRVPITSNCWLGFGVEGPDEVEAMKRFRDTAANRLAEEWGRLLPGEQAGVEAAVAGGTVNANLLPGLHERACSPTKVNLGRC